MYMGTQAVCAVALHSGKNPGSCVVLVFQTLATFMHARYDARYIAGCRQWWILMH